LSTSTLDPLIVLKVLISIDELNGLATYPAFVAFLRLNLKIVPLAHSPVELHHYVISTVNPFTPALKLHGVIGLESL